MFKLPKDTFSLFFNFTQLFKSVIVRKTENKINTGENMSYTRKKQEQIRKYILEKIDDNSSDLAKKTAEAFQTSLNTVYRYIRNMEKEGLIEKKEGTYALVQNMRQILLDRSKGELKEEDLIYDQYIKKIFQEFPHNVIQIWQYSFMEMMNNAIEHSEAEKVALGIWQDYINTTIAIVDNGIGIFRKIKEYYHFKSLDDAVNELFKGKLTTDKKNHSGEGIFFTSRILDEFMVFSDGKIFTHDKYKEKKLNMIDIPELAKWQDRNGTVVLMKLSNYSNKILKEVFDMFSDEDGGFTKTNIPVKNIFETYPVSRSQAKRLCHRFEKFKEIELNFEGIEEIGQGFAHEIFVVFQAQHPEVSLIPLNMSPDVEKMIRHVKKTIL